MIKSTLTSEMGGKYDEPPNAVVTPKIRSEFDVWLQVDLDEFDDDVLHVDSRNYIIIILLMLL